MFRVSYSDYGDDRSRGSPLSCSEYSPTMSLVTLNGATQYLYEAASIGFEAIEEERDEEVETLDEFKSIDELETAYASEDTQYLQDPELNNSKKQKLSNTKLEASLQKASAEIVVETTRQEYNR